MKYYIVCILIVITTICGCTKSSNFLSLNSAEVNQFIIDNNINSLAEVSFIDNNIILFKEGNISGYYMVYKDGNGEVFNQRVAGITNNDDRIIFGGSSTGDNPFMTVIIDDDTYLEKYDQLVIEFDDGSIERMQLNKAHIILTQGRKWRKILLSNDDEDFLLKEL